MKTVKLNLKFIYNPVRDVELNVLVIKTLSDDRRDVIMMILINHEIRRNLFKLLNN